MNTRSILVGTFAFASVLGALVLPVQSQTPPDADAAKVAAVIQELQTQQKLLTENQTKIETQVAAVAEEVRLARIFVSRGGSVKK